MSNDIKTAIKATLAAVKAELGTGKTSPELQQLTRKAIEAAEKVVGTTTSAPTQQRRRG